MGLRKLFTSLFLTFLCNYKVNNVDYPASLELHKIYRVIPDEDAATEGDIRVIDESGEDYLYPSSYFVPIQVPQIVEESLLKAS